jgi:hypothetical protein
MKPTFILTFVLLLLRQEVNADRTFRFIFNDGVPPTPNVGCTMDDNRFIDPIFNITAYLRTRQLSSSSPADHDNHRRLEAYCKNNCAGSVPGTCRASGCFGYRRNLANGGKMMNQDRRETLQCCDLQLTTVHAALDTLILTNTVTPSCKTFLMKSKRKAECFDDIIYGEITSFTLWNMNINNALLPIRAIKAHIAENVADGFQVCSNIPLNVQAVLNPCVNYVNFTGTGPGVSYSRVDNDDPMLLFRTDENRATYGGRYLAPGLYSMTARPDNFAYKEKQLQIRVIAC